MMYELLAYQNKIHSSGVRIQEGYSVLADSVALASLLPTALWASYGRR
jgi:hypothetical protein